MHFPSSKYLNLETLLSLLYLLTMQCTKIHVKKQNPYMESKEIPPCFLSSSILYYILLKLECKMQQMLM